MPVWKSRDARSGTELVCNTDDVRSPDESHCAFTRSGFRGEPHRAPSRDRRAGDPTTARPVSASAPAASIPPPNGWAIAPSVVSGRGNSNPPFRRRGHDLGCHYRGFYARFRFRINFRWAAELVSEVRRDSQQALDEIALGLVKGRKQFGPSVRCLCQCPLLGSLDPKRVVVAKATLRSPPRQSPGAMWQQHCFLPYLPNRRRTEDPKWPRVHSE
jgi:hypothetical protein